MARPRLSEQFVWTDAKVRRLKGYISADLSRQKAAKLLGCSPEQVTEKMDELGLTRTTVRFYDRPRAPRQVQP